ncbi:hypothetical protein [Mesorhizobium amorphae]|uniref:hypothetical protein n=1 Tax=Mesorhizobium amorphae TaxID=71433 RepID=UPI0017834950|nr:hypothetical protein [Mesorhizobium amorphae]
MAAMLAQSSGPGDAQATVIENVSFQRSEPAAGFDDIHLHHRCPTEVRSTTYLQIKRSLTGNRSDNAFRRPVADAAKLLSSGDPGGANFRIVASRSAIAPRDVDRAKAAALLSSDSSDFWSRWSKPGASSETERAYTRAVAWVIEQEFGEADPDLAWRVITLMGIVELDVDQSGSQVISQAVDRLQGALVSGSRAEALQLFETICFFAEDAAKVAGGVNRARLIAELAPRYKLTAAISARACLKRIAADASAALASIRDDIAGVRLARADLTEHLTATLRDIKGLRLGGEAGAGKSAVLRSIAERQRDDGAGVIVLKHDRLTAASWAAHAQLMQVTTSLEDLVEELSAGGSGLLVLDGFDRIMEAGFGSLVREVCDAIQRSPTTQLWRCLVSSRDAAGPEPSLDMPLLTETQPFVIGAPSPEELTFVAQAFPHLIPLMSRRGYADLNRNLFFIDQMARHPSDAGASSELDLMRAWARRGATESARHPSRDATLRSLGEQRLIRPYGPLPKPSDDDGLSRLMSERTVDIPAYRDVVTFAHDIYEEWAVARALDARRAEIPAILKAAGQPLAWMRSIRLVAEVALETDGPMGWRAFHDLLMDDEELDPLWRRLTLTAMLHSPRAENALNGLQAILLEDHARLMKDLVETLRSLEVRPHPVVLSAQEYDHLAPAERRQLAQSAAVPRLVPWYAFLIWSVARWSVWPKSLVPDLSRTALIWLRLGAHGHEPSGRIVAQCVAWLRELDAIHAMPLDDWEERSRLLMEYGAERSGSADPVRKLLRTAIANGAADAVADVDAYLSDLIATGGRGGAEFVETPGVIPTVLAKRYVDLVIAKMILPHDPEKPLDYGVERSDGIRDQGRLFPTSPSRAGCDLLFAADEDQALRLMGALSAAAAAVWRRREASRGLKPRPLALAIEGIEAALWGDQHVFKWSCGLLGPKLLGSLFLAADGWMAKQVEAGRPVGQLCAKVLDSSHLVASASLCLAAAKDRASLEVLNQVLPLLVQPRLWSYDLRLSLEDRRGTAFRIGWRPGDEHAYRTAVVVRERRDRQPSLVEGLIAPLHLVGDSDLKQAFATAVGAWNVGDLAAFDEELEDPDARAELDQELESWRAKADPKNWQFVREPDERTIRIGYAPPENLSERAAEVLDRHEAMEQSGKLLDWAFGDGRAGKTHSGQTFLEALPIAKQMDAPDLFDHALDIDPAFLIRSQGVAAVAAAVAMHGEADLVSAEWEWLVSVFSRAAAIDHQSSPIHFEETVLSEDPAASAARGLGALAMRGLAARELMRIWLGLIASPFRDIAKAALEPAAAGASARLEVCAAGLAVSAESMLYSWHPFDANFEEKMRTSRAERSLGAIDLALDAIDRGEILVPVFPLPVAETFVAGGASNPCAGDPESQFDTYRASALWSGLDIEAICQVSELREILVTYVSDALRWYASFMEFQDSSRSYGATRRMEWEMTLGGIAGRLAALIPSDEAVAKFVLPATSIPDGKTRSDVLAHLLNAFGNTLIVADRPVDSSFETVWRAASQPIFEQARNEAGPRYDPDETALTAAAFALYSLPIFPPEWPRAKELAGLVHEWVTNCARYRFAASIVRRLIAQAGSAFTPSPGLDWLEAILDAHATDSQYWQSGMGDATGEILLLLWSGSDKSARRIHVKRFRAAAARLADRGVSSAAELLSEIAIVQGGG